MNATEPAVLVQAKLGLWDAISIILGIIIGAGIYETPVGVFRMIGDPWLTLGLWLLAGVLALVGALCYAELATTYPRSGGDYVYLTRAYGPLAGYLFGWAQLAVIQTGSIGLMAYIFADYGSRLYHFGEFSSVIYAAGAIVGMTLLNMLGVVLGKTMQNVLTFAKVVGLIGIIVAGFAFASPTKPIVTDGQVEKAENGQLTVTTDASGTPKVFEITDKSQLLIDFQTKTKIKVNDKDEEVAVTLQHFQPQTKKERDATGKELDKTTRQRVKVLSPAAHPTEAAQVFTVGEGIPPYSLIAFAMVLIFLTYGGWNDAAFVAAEVRNRQRNIPLALICGTAGVTVIYLLVNQAYISGLGFEGAQLSREVAADVLKLLPWAYGEQAMCILVMVSALGAVNGLIFTSSRIYATLGADYSLFAKLGQWNAGRGTPIWSLFLQMFISLTMVLAVGTEQGQETLNQGLEYLGRKRVSWVGQGGFYSLLQCTAPIFWLFFLMTGLALFTLRRNDPTIERPFSVPLFPLLPLIFCATCGYMLYSGIGYAGELGLVGAVLVLAGIPFFVFSRRSPGSGGMS
jgi:amino acid transporter